MTNSNLSRRSFLKKVGKTSGFVVLAGGASSRLKKSLDGINLDRSVSEIAKSSHKTLIPLGDDKRPLLYFILQKTQDYIYYGLLNFSIFKICLNHE